MQAQLPFEVVLWIFGRFWLARDEARAAAKLAHLINEREIGVTLRYSNHKSHMIM